MELNLPRNTGAGAASAPQQWPPLFVAEGLLRQERERERESYGTGFLFEEPNPEREPPKRPNWAL